MNGTDPGEAPRRLFGTDGLRGRAGEPPLDPAGLTAIGLALGRVLSSALGRPPRIVIGRDTRASGPELLALLSGGLRAAGATVRSAGVLPTPGVSFLARGGDFDAGIVLSASHNPHEDNGLKIFSAGGTKLGDELEREVEAAIELELGSARRLPPTRGLVPDEPELASRHADWLEDRARALGLDLRGWRLCVDCANGAASPFAAGLLRALGAEVFALHDRPDGRNINAGCGSLHPESLAAAVQERGAALGIAFDGDADRALLVDARGRLVDGDVILLLAADWLLGRGLLRGGAVVGTVMSNLGLSLALAERGLALHRAPVGDRFVLERMRETGTNLGGEPSGHVIFLDEAPTGDGLLTALLALSALAASEHRLEEIHDAFPRTPQVLCSVPVRARVPLAEVEGFPELSSEWTTRFGDSGRLLVRYSGTEPLVRIMAEGADAHLVERCARALAEHLHRALGAP